MPTPMTPLRSRPGAFALTLVAAIILSACSGLTDQLTANHFAVATLVQIPDQKNPSTQETVPGLVTFQLVFGLIDRTKIVGPTAGAGAFSGLADAQVKLLFQDPTRGATEINVAHQGAGIYRIDSQTASQLAYHPIEYVVQIVSGSETHRLKVTAPEQAAIQEFVDAGALPVLTHAAGTPFTVTRASPMGVAGNPIAFVALSRLTGNARADEWTNLPKDPFAFLSFVLADDAWRQDSFTIPGESFASGQAYAVTMTSTKEGGGEDGSSPLFIGSTFLAGVASSGAVVVP